MRQAEQVERPRLGGGVGGAVRRQSVVGRRCAIGIGAVGDGVGVEVVAVLDHVAFRLDFLLAGGRWWVVAKGRVRQSLIVKAHEWAHTGHMRIADTRPHKIGHFFEFF